MDRRAYFPLYKKSKKLAQKSASKSGVIFMDQSPQVNPEKDVKILKLVNNRIAQPATETNIQTSKEGTGESMYTPSGGFERF